MGTEVRMHTARRQVGGSTPGATMAFVERSSPSDVAADQAARVVPCVSVAHGSWPAPRPGQA